MSKNRRARRKGFTLMEVLLVLVILVILGSMAGMFIRGAQKRAREDAARAQIGLFENAIEMYELHLQRYPSPSEGLEGLVPADRFFGALFGLARGFAILFVAVLLGGLVGMAREPWWAHSLFAPAMESAVIAAKPWLPGAVADRIRFR